jgi:hypothetical protein
MHAFGLNRDLCCDFLKKQCHVLSLTKGTRMKNEINFHILLPPFTVFHVKHVVFHTDYYYLFSTEQEKLLHDNINRLYRETEPWREQVHK